MTEGQQLDWLRENDTLVFHSKHKFMLWRTPYAFVEAGTLEEAIELMMEQMGMVEGAIREAHQPRLLESTKGEHDAL